DRWRRDAGGAGGGGEHRPGDAARGGGRRMGRPGRGWRRRGGGGKGHGLDGDGGRSHDDGQIPGLNRRDVADVRYGAGLVGADLNDDRVGGGGRRRNGPDGSRATTAPWAH